jgi:hypothetical protein
VPLISHGSFDTFTGVTDGPARTEAGVEGPQPFAVLREVTRALQPLPVTFVTTPDPVAAGITGLSLTGGARAMLRGLLDPGADLHVLAWVWDLSGAPPVVLPGEDAKRWRLSLRDGVRTAADGPLPLWTGRPVVGGLVTRILLWQNGSGPVAGEVAEAMRHTRLASTLAAVGGTGRTTITSAVMIREAAGALGGELAPVLRALCADYLDLFEGHFPAGAEPGGTFTGYHSRIGVGTVSAA